ncbi:M24 family metallopeptidase [Patescibacteria group bacterium]|nr:MAG: M24 family metallopeptidase [Patescibacteria group bacterium]
MNADFFRKNRKNLLATLNKGALVVLTGYGEVQQVNDATAPFEQEGNFLYLTGVEAPDWWVILDGSAGSEWLVAPSLSESQKIFDGETSNDEVTKVSGISTVIDRDEAMRRLRQLTRHHSVVYVTEQPKWLSDHSHFQLNSAQADLKKMLERMYDNVQGCNRELARLRAIKSDEEVVAIKKAIKVTAEALDAMKMSLPELKYEYELQAVLDFEIRRRGARHAYAPIVAGGRNACTLHYGLNRDRLDRRSLVLLDVGARVNGYAADISRTYAVTKPTKRQRAVYDAVVAAQQKIIASLKPGLPFQSYEEKVEEAMKAALSGLGLTLERYREYFPHAVSHGLGVDVHDSLGGYDILMPGMVLTVEPGLYLSDEGIGVRIEDNILITETGHDNLSKSISTDL